MFRGTMAISFSPDHAIDKILLLLPAPLEFCYILSHRLIATKLQIFLDITARASRRSMLGFTLKKILAFFPMSKSSSALPAWKWSSQLWNIDGGNFCHYTTTTLIIWQFSILFSCMNSPHFLRLSTHACVTLVIHTLHTLSLGAFVTNATAA